MPLPPGHLPFYIFVNAVLITIRMNTAEVKVKK